MPTKVKGTIGDVMEHSSLPPEDVLSLRRLDDHPEMAEVVSVKQRLSDCLAASEAEIQVSRKQVVLYSSTSRQGQFDPALDELLRETQQRLKTQEAQHLRLIGELRLATTQLDTARAHARLAVLPELAAQVLPKIQERLSYLEQIAQVQRLLGQRHIKSAVELRDEQEIRHLNGLIALLCPQDPA